MHLPTPQGSDCATFAQPPLDGSLTIPEIYERQAANSPNHPLFVFPEAPGQLRTICYAEVVQAIHNAAHIVESAYMRCKDRYILQKQMHNLDPTFGILAAADTISYTCLIMGVMNLGYTAFPISTRNSPAAVAHLLSKTGVLQLFVSPDPAMQRLSREALDILARDGHKVEVLPVPQFEDLFLGGNNGKQAPPVARTEKLKADGQALILHSSGSTAFPKPIFLTHRMLLQWGSTPYYGEMDICSKVLAVHPLPSFHAMGTITIFWACCTGVVLGCFKPSSPPTIPTPDSVFEGIISTNADIIFCVPSFIERWAQHPRNISIMKGMTCIGYGGAPMSKAIGDYLSQQGVPLLAHYGITEAGCMSLFHPVGKSRVDEWEYFKFSPHIDIRKLPKDGFENLYEVVLVETDSCIPAVKNRTIDNRGAYATNDLVLPHPTDPTRWKVFGREDDQIMLSTGEKTNPGPLEAILLRDPHIFAAVMFGRGRSHNGVLVQPKEPYAFDVGDVNKLESFRNAIWKSIERLNEYAPSHSRLFKEMIVVTTAQKPLEYTAKGTPRRQIALKMYSEEIEAAYAAVEESAQIGVNLPKEWTSETTLQFVREVVNKVLVVHVRDTDDIFQYGCDSLQATKIRNSLLQALRETPQLSQAVDWRTIPHNFVYTHPSILSLGDFVVSLCLIEGNDRTVKEAEGESKIRQMESLVSKYTANLPKHQPSKTANSAIWMQEAGEVILLTGTTGRLGCYLLAQLITTPSVTYIFALNRPSSRSGLRERQRDAFVEWGLDLELLSSPKLQLLEMNMGQPFLGLKQLVFEKVRDSITGVIHNAWRVDFNITLSSFEPLIKGTRELINLSLSSPKSKPPYILFTSSISVFNSYTEPEPAEEGPIPDPRMAIGTGYSESKWVAERILETVARETTMRTTVVRVGQICGGRENGAWNQKEWVPVIIKSGQVLGCLPSRDEEITWVPPDIAASAILEMRDADQTFLHLVHPNPVQWSTIFTAAAEILQMPLVPYTEWLTRLEASHQSGKETVESNPALKLLSFFLEGALEHLPDGSTRLRRLLPSLLTDRACQVSPTLAHADRLNKQSMERWVSYWRRLGFLEG